jgi:hypothetical protein
MCIPKQKNEKLGTEGKRFVVSPYGIYVYKPWASERGKELENPENLQNLRRSALVSRAILKTAKQVRVLLAVSQTNCKRTCAKNVHSLAPVYYSKNRERRWTALEIRILFLLRKKPQNHKGSKIWHIKERVSKEKWSVVLKNQALNPC